MIAKDMDFLQVGVACPMTRVADINYNVEQIIYLIEQAHLKDIKLLVFPELSVTSSTCANLFYSSQLLLEAEKGLKKICNITRNKDMLVMVGFPIHYGNSLYNTCVFMKDGLILGITPKSYANAPFGDGKDISNCLVDLFFQKDIPFGSNMILKSGSIRVAAEIGDDVFGIIPPSSILASLGANIICNLSALPALAGRSEYIENLLNTHSANLCCAYLYSSAGVYESSTDFVFSGQTIIVEDGVLLKKGLEYSRYNSFISSVIDISFLNSQRLKNHLFHYNNLSETPLKVNFSFTDNSTHKYNRNISKFPFIPENPQILAKRCDDLLLMQGTALAKRMDYTKMDKVILGVSGGLDSTLALIACAKAMELLELPTENILTYTLPGFGTTNRTYDNAVALCKALNTTFHEISIVNSCLQHFNDIGHNPTLNDTTYENAQARERTQILMDTANKENALLVGTGDLSEGALGWCTYNGDHMSMYSINCSLPKTLIRSMINHIAVNHADSAISKLLLDVLNTPISPELLPKDAKGNLVQKTEEAVGPYELHDFFLYYFIKQNATPERILFFANIAFDGVYETAYIEKTFNFFIKRFFTQQFKRSASPDGPKLGSITLSARNDWNMPSDAAYNIWLKD